MDDVKKVAVIGAGPAGLTAAYILSKAGVAVTVFEQDSTYVGGISRTETYKGFHFDIGGHRFFSKAKKVEDFWTEILGDDLLERPRKSRIYYNNQFFSYPLSAREALAKLGIFELVRCVASYIKAKLFPINNPANFQDWVTNHFGKRLFNIFFKTYTEKVWGTSCKNISADWASQRIKGLSLSSAIKSAFFKPGRNDKIIKTLIDTFRYPKYGPGMMWQACTQKVKEFGGIVQMGCPVQGIELKGDWFVHVNDTVQGPYHHIISSAAIGDIVPNILPRVSRNVSEAAANLKYRDFLTVILITEENYFTDNWIYIHDPSVTVGRIQNFKSWSQYMVPDPEMACYGLEYFCFKNDGLWNSSDADLIALGKSEMEKIGFGKAVDVVDGYVVRQAKAYPVYDNDYKDKIDCIKHGLQAYKGLHLVGRNGMHKYNNQDHSMMTAMLAAENILAGAQLYNLWNVNGDAEYHESGERQDDKGRLVPKNV